VRSDAAHVSVVMPTYGKRALLESTLGALAAQTYPADRIEVLVVDDCSEDDTPDFLSKAEFPFRLVSLRHEINRGRAAARNTGLRAAAGEIVVFLDDDMRATPELIDAHVVAQRDHPRTAMIGNALTAPELGPSSVYSYLDSRGAHKLPPDAPMPARYFLTNNASVPKDAFGKAGLFDESFRSYGFEDMEIAFRLEERAHLAFRYCSTAVAYHIHEHTLDGLLEKRLDAARSSLPLLLKLHPGRADELSLRLLLPIRQDDSPWLRLRKSALRVLLARPFQMLSKPMARSRRLGRLAHPFLDHLIAAAYARGLRDAG